MARVSPDDRFTRRNPDPVCGGHKDMPQHQGTRCVGYYREDRNAAFCSRLGAGTGCLEVQTEAGPVYMHLLTEPCPCGVDHRDGASVVIPMRKRQDEPEWRPMLPVPDSAPAPTFTHASGKPSRKWAYLDARGRVMFYRVRFDHAGGGKDVKPHTYCEGPSGRREWRWQDVPKPRPLYGLDRLAAHPDADVLVCEGEKAADAAQAMFPDLVVITWPGGTGGVLYADWSRLKGRRVTFWPDADTPEPDKGFPEGKGVHAAQQAAALCVKAGAASVRIVALPGGLPHGWDLADMDSEVSHADA